MLGVRIDAAAVFKASVCGRAKVPFLQEGSHGETLCDVSKMSYHEPGKYVVRWDKTFAFYYARYRVLSLAGLDRDVIASYKSLPEAFAAIAGVIENNKRVERERTRMWLGV